MLTLKSYKGYEGYIRTADNETGDLVGRVAGIRDVVSFVGRTIPELQREFEASVDDYLEQCEEDGVEPNRPASGRFNVRLDPQVHRRAACLAEARGESLNDFAVRAFTHEIESLSAQPACLYMYAGELEEAGPQALIVVQDSNGRTVRAQVCDGSWFGARGAAYDQGAYA
jgi:predicted HicB family RNase H-like nuclease